MLCVRARILGANMFPGALDSCLCALPSRACVCLCRPSMEWAFCRWLAWVLLCAPPAIVAQLSGHLVLIPCIRVLSGRKFKHLLYTCCGEYAPNPVQRARTWHISMTLLDCASSQAMHLCPIGTQQPRQRAMAKHLQPHASAALSHEPHTYPRCKAAKAQAVHAVARQQLQLHLAACMEGAAQLGWQPCYAETRGAVAQLLIAAWQSLRWQLRRKRGSGRERKGATATAALLARAARALAGPALARAAAAPPARSRSMPGAGSAAAPAGAAAAGTGTAPPPAMRAARRPSDPPGVHPGFRRGRRRQPQPAGAAAGARARRRRACWARARRPGRP